MGGDLYARFAACYLKLSGMDEIQQPMKLQRDMKEHEEGTQAQAAVLKVIDGTC